MRGREPTELKAKNGATAKRSPRKGNNSPLYRVTASQKLGKNTYEFKYLNGYEGLAPDTNVLLVELKYDP